MCRTCIIRTFIDFLNFLLFQQTICPTATYKEGVRKQGVGGSRRILKRGRRIGFIACNGDVTGLGYFVGIVDERRGEFALLPMDLEVQSISTMEEFHAFKHF